ALEISAADNPTFGQLAQAINDLAGNNVLRAEVPLRFKNVDATTLVDQLDTALSGGSDGTSLSKQDLFEKLGGKRDASGNILELGAYQLLENYTTDMVVVTGAYHDDKLVGKYDSF